MEISFGNTNSQLTGPIVDGTCIRQVFSAPTDTLKSISVFFSTYGKTLDGVVVAEIIDFLTEKKIATVQGNACELKDNDWYSFVFDLPVGMKQKYELRIWTINCRAGQSFTAYYGSKKNWGHMFVGSKLIRSSELKCRFVYAEEIK